MRAVNSSPCIRISCRDGLLGPAPAFLGPLRVSSSRAPSRSAVALVRGRFSGPCLLHASGVRAVVRPALCAALRGAPSPASCLSARSVRPAPWRPRRCPHRRPSRLLRSPALFRCPCLRPRRSRWSCLCLSPLNDPCPRSEWLARGWTFRLAGFPPVVRAWPVGGAGRPRPLVVGSGPGAATVRFRDRRVDREHAEDRLGRRHHVRVRVRLGRVD